MGCMRSSKWDEGLSFHLRNRVQPRAMAPTVEAMTTMMIRVLRVICDVEVLEDKLEPLEGVGVADVRIVLVVPSGAAYETPPGVIIPVACDPAELAAGAPVVSEAGAEEVETAVDDAEDEELLWLDEAEDAAEEPDELADVLLAADD